MNIYISFGYSLLLMSFVWAQTPPVAKCPADKVLVPIFFQFKDTDVQSTWVYESLRPTLILNGSATHPQSKDIEGGAAKFKFCMSPPKDAARLILQVGPRTHDLAMRPVTKDVQGTQEMSEILLLNQPRPDWVIFKSAERVYPQGSKLPAFDVELFNFGQTHAGGHVLFESAERGWHCLFGTPPTRVEVQVSISGRRLKVASSDPEYPEELISRPAQLDENINYCHGNYSLKTDFGPTGRIPPGPLRIRYILKGARIKNLTVNEEFIPYFFARSYKIDVVGEGIW